jgi:hypothetical protein
MDWQRFFAGDCVATWREHQRILRVMIDAAACSKTPDRWRNSKACSGYLTKW